MHLRVSLHAIPIEQTNMRVDAASVAQPAHVSAPILPGNDYRYESKSAANQEEHLFPSLAVDAYPP